VTRARLRGSIAALLLLPALLGVVVSAGAETVRKGDLQVAFEGKLTPNSLPRSGETPVTVSVSAKVSSTGTEPPPAMHQIQIAINAHGRIDPAALPVCSLEQIQPATTDDALAACRRSLVGEGRFLANVVGHPPFPAEGKIYAFNGEVEGKPAILAHVYGTVPAPASYTLAFVISRSKGTFGTILKATLPPVVPGSGYITAIYLKLGRTLSAGGRRRSYISASCPAPKGFPGATFPFAKASVGFQGGTIVGTTLVRNCKAKD
jgi:hypothetical protein